MNTPHSYRPDGFAARLREQRAQLVERIREHLHRSEDPDRLALANHLDSGLDWTEADALAENDIAIVKHELDELKEIDAALRRVASGDYGTCMRCGDAIAEARLLAQPSARFCTSCQSAFEKQSGGHLASA